MIEGLVVNGFHNFSLYPNTILGTQFKNAQLLGEINHELAMRIVDVNQLHEQFYRNLPEGTPSDNTRYSYYHFRVKGVDYVIADVWIVPGTPELTKGESYIIELENVERHQVTRIREQLTLLGITFTIK